MSALLTVVTRSESDPLRVEEYLAREHPEAVDEPAGAPSAAGGAL